MPLITPKVLIPQFPLTRLVPSRLAGESFEDYGSGLLITSFTQALGGELLTDGGIEIWTSATNATYYTESLAGASTINREGTDVHGGSFAARHDYDASDNGANLEQALSTVSAGNIVEISVWMKSQPTGKQPRISVGLIASIFTVTNVYTQRATLVRAAANTPNFVAQRQSAALASLYFDDMSAKRLTLNTAYQVAVNLRPATFYATLPASPVTGQTVFLWYCGLANGDELYNGWAAKLVYSGSQWQAGLDSYSTGTATTRISLTNVGTPDSVRVEVNGNTHKLYTGLAGVFTQRGADVTNTTHNTGTWLNTIYSSAVTPVRLEAA